MYTQWALYVIAFSVFCMAIVEVVATFYNIKMHSEAFKTASENYVKLSNKVFRLELDILRLKHTEPPLK